MKFIVRNIGGGYQEMEVDEISTGTMNQKEAINLAQKIISAAEDLLYIAGLRVASDACGTIVEDLNDYI